MKKIIFMFFALITFFAQSHPDSLEPRYDHIIKFAPLRLLHLSEPAAELSYEYRFNRQWSAQLRGGYIVRLFEDPVIQRQQGYVAGLEGRHYFGKKSDLFLGSEVSYTDFDADCRAVFTETGSILNPQNYSDDFKLSKNVLAATLRVGKSFQFDRFGMEISVGYSTVNRSVKHFEREHPEDDFSFQDFKTAIRGLDEGTSWFFRIPGQFRLNYSF
jgi:hypothetical protein